MRLFAWFTQHYLVDYYYVFILLPLLLTGLLGVGFLWIEELTLRNAKTLYTPVGAPVWNEEKILAEVRR